MTSPLRVVLLALACASLLAQGPLTPPGPPGPAMRSLDQVEARTPLGTVGGSTATLIISSPGSYVLMGNVTVTSGDGILIAAENVTLDLNGFTVLSTARNPEGAGISIGSSTSGRHLNMFIHNGFIRGGVSYSGGSFSGTGFRDGIRIRADTPSDTSANLRVADVVVSGVERSGIDLDPSGSAGPNLVVERCQVRTAGAGGINATRVTDSHADECGFSGITAIAALRCSGRSVGASFDGISAAVATECVGASSGANGRGLFATVATACHGSSQSNGIGLVAGTADHCYGFTSSGPYGMDVTGSASFCRASGPTVALRAGIAVACTSSSGSISSPSKQLGTP